MKVIVTGGRNYDKKDKVYQILDELNPDIVVHGDCSGADYLSSMWVKDRNKTEIKYPYLSQYGRAGGPIRNKQMCEENLDSILVAFPGGNGTLNCISQAQKFNIKIIKVLE